MSVVDQTSGDQSFALGTEHPRVGWADPVPPTRVPDEHSHANDLGFRCCKTIRPAQP